jgi:hypothetical protein
MPVPGLIPSPGSNTLSIAYRASVDNVDLFADLGSPPGVVDVTVLVADGIEIGAALKPGATEPDPALLIDGFADGSRVYLINRGTIAGGGGIGGQGDRGKRIDETSSNFVGGGGGGGAGSSSQGGAAATESDPDDGSTNGAAGTATTGGAAGVNDSGVDIGNGPFVRGTAAQLGGCAIRAIDIDLTIDNAAGEIFAGANGGEGGYQDAPLPLGAVDPEDGDDLPSSVTLSSTTGPEAEAVWISGGELTWIAGDTYPSVAGYVREVA